MLSVPPGSSGQGTASAPPPPGVVSVPSTPPSASVEPQKPKQQDKSKQRVMVQVKMHVAAVAIHCLEGTDTTINTVPQAISAFRLRGNQVFLKEMSDACLARIQQGGQVPVLCPKPDCNFILSGTNSTYVASHLATHQGQEYAVFKKGWDMYHELVVAVYFEPGMDKRSIHKHAPTFHRNVATYFKDLDVMADKAKTKKLKNKKLACFAALFALAMKEILPAVAEKAWGDRAAFPAKKLLQYVSQAAREAQVSSSPSMVEVDADEKEVEAPPSAKKAKVQDEVQDEVQEDQPKGKGKGRTVPAKKVANPKKETPAKPTQGKGRGNKN